MIWKEKLDLPARARSMGPSTVGESGFTWGPAQVKPCLVSGAGAAELKYLV